MKSEGSAAEHQSACLGVYRSVDWCNHRPVYKQEDGENYLYYNNKLKSWMVASYVGNEYAWMRYEVHDGEDDKSSSSSSSSSSSDSDDGGSDEEKRQKKKVKKISWRGLRTPDLFNPGWQYKLSPPDAQQRVWIAPLGLALGVWQGTRENRTGYWLRWWNSQGELLPWGKEQVEQEHQLVEQERQLVEQERQRAEQERQRADRLAAQLRAAGIDPEA